MQQKGFLICKLYNFIFIYFSSNNFNYPKQKLAIPSKLIKFFRKSFAEFPQNFCKLAWVLGSVPLYDLNIMEDDGYFCAKLRKCRVI